VGPKGKVYAFEPDPRNYNILIKNIHANSYDNIIIPMQKIISGPKQSPYLNLFLPQDGQGSSIYNRQSFNIHSESAIVETVTLDAFLQKEGWPQVNVIKMDIEGSEKFALEGMKQVVDRNQDLKLIMEFGPNMLFDAGIVPDELFHILIELGFNKYWVIKKDLQPINIPTDISLLVEMADNDYINLFCEIK
jgi:FkbM family methyltransferase